MNVSGGGRVFGRRWAGDRAAWDQLGCFLREWGWGGGGIFLTMPLLGGENAVRRIVV